MIHPAAENGVSRGLLWSTGGVLMGLAAFMYLSDPSLQQFERIFPFRQLRPVLQPFDGLLPGSLRAWLPDAAWAWAAALFTAELLPSGRAWWRALLVLLAAASWEGLQGLGWVAGVFDVRDLAASLLAGAVVWVLYALTRRESAA